jgi:Na+-translocating ferredoxin:NAD+ oxidoreductase RnfC subunit
LGNFYPAGDEQVLVYEVLKRIVPEGGLPLQVGAVVMNVETALNVYRAYTEESPVIDTYVTVTGAVRTPKTVLVPLGITVGETLQLAEGATSPDYQIIDGGPMMGSVVTPEHIISKTTKGLIVLPAAHPLLLSLNKPITRMLKDACIACMQCSLCSVICPRGLLGHKLAPHKLMRLAAYGSLCEYGQTPLSAYLCCGCRLCEYACVMGLQPWKLNERLKEILSAQELKNNLHHKPEKTDPFRELLRYPMKKLLMQLGLSIYDLPAPLEQKRYVFTKVRIPLKQHIGAPALPIVQAGDIVARGDLIARIPAGQLSANLHASIAGKVSAVTAESITIER